MKRAEIIKIARLKYTLEMVRWAYTRAVICGIETLYCIRTMHSSIGTQPHTQSTRLTNNENARAFE